MNPSLPPEWAFPNRWPRYEGYAYLGEVAWRVGDLLQEPGWREKPGGVGVDEIAAWIGARCRDGRMNTVLEPPMDHLRRGLIKGDNADWFDDSHFSRVLRCQVLRPVAGGGTQRFRCFVVRTDLDRCLSESAAIPSPPQDVADVHLSPYIRLMIEVARREAITPGHQPKKSTVEETLVELAPRFGLDFANGNEAAKLRYLATFVREPDSQKGRAVTKG